MSREWKCQQVGDCCKQNPVVTMTFQEAALLERESAKATRPLQFVPRVEPNRVNLIAGPCPFYVNGCAVYDVRPYNCRRGGCFRWDPQTEPFELDPMPKVQADPALRKSYDRQQTTAQVWALAHGWTV